MGIGIASNFTLGSPLALDDRTVFADTTARDALASGRRYEGLTVYVVADQTKYTLKGGITNSDWEPEGGSGLTTADMIPIALIFG